MSRRSTRSRAAATAAQPSEPQQLSSPPATPVPTKRGTRTQADSKRTSTTPKAKVAPHSSSRKRPRSSIKLEDCEEKQPHEVGEAPPAKGKSASPKVKTEDASPPKRRKTATKNTKSKEPPDLSKDQVLDMADKLDIDPATVTPAKKSKEDGLDLDGVDPYPDWPHPTAEECWEVYNLLDKSEPGNHARPEKVPPPRLDVAGCGEVPHVLDALIRTLLSAATNGRNSRAAFKGLQDAFGVKDGSVDWENVRRASQPEVEKAIRCGGLSNNKSKSIKGILEQVYEENEQRLAKLRDSGDGPAGTSNTDSRDAEIDRTEKNMLNLDHLHLLDDKDAFRRLTKFKGIGEKTASCVMLFCMQRASFAVDTHVFRLCRWLGWVPPKSWVDAQNSGTKQIGGDEADEYSESPKKGSAKKKTSPQKKGKAVKLPPVGRNTTFRHCDVRIPGELKYPLHQLLISHGKHCPRCQAITSVHSKDWKKGCPIERLVKRDGARKGGAAADVDSDEVEDWEEEEEEEEEDD